MHGQFFQDKTLNDVFFKRPEMVKHPCDPKYSWFLRQDDGKFEFSLGNLMNK